MKKGKINYDSAVKQINALLPDDMRDVMLANLDACKESGEKIYIQSYWKISLNV